jgi:hypothetical protein
VNKVLLLSHPLVVERDAFVYLVLVLHLKQLGLMSFGGFAFGVETLPIEDKDTLVFMQSAGMSDQSKLSFVKLVADQAVVGTRWHILCSLLGRRGFLEASSIGDHAFPLLVVAFHVLADFGNLLLLHDGCPGLFDAYFLEGTLVGVAA